MVGIILDFLAATLCLGALSLSALFLFTQGSGPWGQSPMSDLKTAACIVIGLGLIFLSFFTMLFFAGDSMFVGLGLISLPFFILRCIEGGRI